MKKMTGILTIALLLSGQSLFAQGWGTITGKIVVDGAPPQLPVLVTKGDPVVKNASVCAVKTIPDDSMVIGKKGGLANCFIYFYESPDKKKRKERKKPDIHPALIKPAQEKIQFDNKGCVFTPHTLVVRVSQKVNATNTDACGHNVHTFPLRNIAFNQLIAANDKKGIDIDFKKGEPLPMQVTCDIHPWMTAKWLVVDHPYAVITDKEGKFTIKLVPEGRHIFRIWHERIGYVKKGGKNKIEVKVKDGKTFDLGVIKVSAAALKKP